MKEIREDEQLECSLDCPPTIAAVNCVSAVSNRHLFGAHGEVSRAGYILGGVCGPLAS